MSVRRTRIARIATAVAMTFALTACGGSDTPDKDASPEMSAAPEQTASTAAPKAGALIEEDFVKRVTAAQRKAKASQVKMTVDSGGQKNIALGQFRAGDSVENSAVTLTVKAEPAGAGSLEMRAVDGTLYMNFGKMTDNKFTKLSLDGSDDAAAGQLGVLIRQVDPSAQLALFDTSLKSFKQAGDAKKMDGVEVLPYEFVLDTSEINGIEEVAKAAGVKAPATLTYTMFVGDDDLPRQVTAKLVGMSATVDYSKWGEPVEIKAPSTKEITDTPLGGS